MIPCKGRNSFLYLLLLICAFELASCGGSKFISKQASQNILSDSNFTAAHVGISIYDPAANKYLYNYQGDKYFIPASNTKLFTCYAAMKHLGDSLVGARIQETDVAVNVYGTADPTFLLSEYKYQPVFQFLKSKPDKGVHLLAIHSDNEQFKQYGYGWTWSDYQESYMPERSFFPIYGNVVTFSLDISGNIVVNPATFKQNVFHFKNDSEKLNITRQLNGNSFTAFGSSRKSNTVIIPFKTSDDARGVGKYVLNTTSNLLADALGVAVNYESITGLPQQYKIIHSQPTDSVLKPMMHRSDNFFAEQILLMVSNEMTGVMNDAMIIDSLLKTDYKDLPQKPRWVDGSGLSRYNLFSPNDFVFLLNKMKNNFSWDRITTILPTGGEGTLNNYYITLKDRIFAKTGSLSNNLALSGFLITKQNKTLIFSVLVNNHMGSATQIRKAVEKFLTSVADKY